jgi:hypothetical protein
MAAVAFADARPAGSIAAITVSPEPGAVAASRATQISLRGARAAELGTITVTGSRSGAHPGRLVAHSDGNGASFLPDRPFKPGERVSVATQLSVHGAATGSYRFTVGRGALESRDGAGIGLPEGNFAQQRFRSRPDLRPPTVTVDVRRAGHTRGEILLATKQGRRDGALILDDHGDVVWFRPERRGWTATDLRLASWKGKPALTLWEGRFVIGFGFGQGIVLDDRYREVARVRAGNGLQADLHDFVLTPRGTALLTIYHRVRHAGEWVMDGIVQEVDVATGLVLYEWHALDHVSPSESYEPRRKGSPWDWFHINSAQALPDGDLVISARNTHAIYRVNRSTGSVEWRLGGTRSDFVMGRGTRFAWQHDARLNADGTLTLFDNSADPPLRKRSRALRLRLDGRRATLVAARAHPGALLSPNQGGVQDLGGGRMFVGWGRNPWFTEFDRNGRILFDAHLAAGYDSYRAYRVAWTGRPAERPAVAAARSADGGVNVWASWNGATEVTRWELLAGTGPDALVVTGSRPRRGFETTLRAPRGTAWVAARALAGDGSVLGVSRAVAVGR